MGKHPQELRPYGANERKTFKSALCHLLQTEFPGVFGPTGTGLENSAGFERESGATGASRGVSGVLGAFVSVARHAVKCAEELRTDVVA